MSEDEESARNRPLENGRLTPLLPTGVKTSADGLKTVLLTKNELLRIDTEQPIWRRMRIAILIGFCVLWIALIVALILIVVLSPRCPPRPKLEFWQAKTGYWLNPFAFKDSGDDGVGDFKGLEQETSYISKEIGAGFVILSPIFQGEFSNTHNITGLTEDYEKPDSALGTLAEFRSMIKAFHKQGVEVVLSIDFNSISTNHNWSKTANFLVKTEERDLVSRTGGQASVQLHGQTFYSSFGENAVDLDLNNAEVMEKIKDVIIFWLKQGADGFLLKNVAFYVERWAASEAPLSLQSNNPWFKNDRKRQILNDQSLRIVREIRNILENNPGGSNKKRVVILDPGNIGFGPTKVLNGLDPFESNETVAAHLLINRELVHKRGWKIDQLTMKEETYDTLALGKQLQGSQIQMALLTATDTDRRHRGIISLASMFLLPGTPIIYYGTELGENVENHARSPTEFYPKGKTVFPGLHGSEDILTCVLPMPWDQTGERFSKSAKRGAFSEYLKEFHISETVASETATGRGSMPIQLVKKLVALRNEPSLKWGTFEVFASGNQIIPKQLRVFVRRAVGFPTFIVVINDRRLFKEGDQHQATIDFSNLCENVRLELAYPDTEKYSTDKTIGSKNIYFNADHLEAVYVFKCV